jgi:Protein of unknown function (DUF3634)
MEYIAAIAILTAGVAVGVFLATRSKGSVFVVRVRDGFPTVTRGVVSQAFVADLAGVLKEKGIRSGSIYGVRRANMTRLEFSRSIPSPAYQALRNVWAMHGR